MTLLDEFTKFRKAKEGTRLLVSDPVVSADAGRNIIIPEGTVMSLRAVTSDGCLYAIADLGDHLENVLIRLENMHCIDIDDEVEFGVTAATGWQPMDSAPKDGTTIDLWVRAEHSGFCFRQAQCSWIDEIEDWGPLSSTYPLKKLKLTPLFWMPQPPPPVARRDDGWTQEFTPEEQAEYNRLYGHAHEKSA